MDRSISRYIPQDTAFSVALFVVGMNHSNELSFHRERCADYDGDQELATAIFNFIVIIKLSNKNKDETPLQVRFSVPLHQLRIEKVGRNRTWMRRLNLSLHIFLSARFFLLILFLQILLELIFNSIYL